MGIYTSFVNGFIKEFCPVSLTGHYGTYHQLAVVCGILGAFVWNFLLDLIFQDELIYWRLIFIFPVLPCLFQTYMFISKFPFDTPR